MIYIMDTIQENTKRSYEKPATKKHDSLNTVQGSLLYVTTLYKTTLYSLYRLYYTSLYYYH